MANRSLRRTTNKPDGSTGGSVDTAPVVDDSARTKQDVIGNASADDNNVDGKFDSVEQFRAVEIDPNNIDKFIASGGTASTGSSDTGGGTTTKRKYTRRTSKESTQDITAIGDLLLLAHTTMGTLLHTPELLMSKDEATKLSDAYNEFAKYHTVPILTPKRKSEILLLTCVGTVYGTRAIAWLRRKKMERMQPKSNVVAMPNVQPIQHTVMPN